MEASALRTSDHVGAGTGPSATAAEEALKLLPGAYFDIQQGIDEHGLPIDSPVDTKSSKPASMWFRICACMISALELCPWLQIPIRSKAAVL